MDKAERKKTGLRLPLILILSGILILSLFFGNDISLFFTAPKPFVQKFFLGFRDDRGEIKFFIREMEGDWIVEESALLLPPMGKGRLVISFTKDPDLKTSFLLYPSQVKKSSAELFADVDGTGMRSIPLKGKKILAPGLFGKRESRLILKAEVKGGNAPVMLLQGMEQILETKQALSLVPFPALLALFFLPIVLYYGLFRKSCPLLSFLVFFFSVCLAKIFSSSFLPLFLFSAFWFLSLVSVLLWRDRESKPAILGFLMILILVILGFYLRWPKLVENVGYPLDPDAQGFLTIAQKEKGLFQTSCDFAPYIREPFFIWFIRSTFLIVGNRTDTALRFLTVILSLCVIPATYYAGKRWFDSFPAFLAALFSTVNPYFVSMSVRGLRMELSILSVLLLLTCLAQLSEKDKWSAVRLGIAAGVCALIRITSLSFAIPLTLYFGFRNKMKPLSLALSLGIPFILISPHLYFNYKARGDPLFSSNIHAQYYRNREFAGKPGFPALDEVAKDPYAGEKISMREYLFSLHSVPQVLQKTFKGLGNIFLRSYVRGGLFGYNKIFFLFYLFGCAVTLFSRRWEWLMIAVILEIPSAFLASMGLDWRLALHISPLIYLFTGNGIRFLLVKFLLFRYIKSVERG